MGANRTILVSGRNGQLGSEIVELSSLHPQYAVVALSHAEMDISDINSIESAFEKYNPVFFVNTAAYTAVDKAESDQKQAYLINAEAPGIIARICNRHNTKLIHISTDYVFDGTATVPYKEDDEIKPINYYGYSKSMGEQFALHNNPSTVVIRTSWVYSKHGNNFVKTMLRLMKEREAINVVSDQFGSPTWAKDLAATILHIVDYSCANPDKFRSGIYHYSNEGIISWYDFATAIRDFMQLKCEVNPIATAQYPTPAKRPAWSVMSKEKIKTIYGIDIPLWEDSIRSCLTQF